jgi:hypothetical protein
MRARKIGSKKGFAKSSKKQTKTSKVQKGGAITTPQDFKDATSVIEQHGFTIKDSDKDKLKTTLKKFSIQQLKTALKNPASDDYNKISNFLEKSDHQPTPPPRGRARSPPPRAAEADWQHSGRPRASPPPPRGRARSPPTRAAAAATVRDYSPGRETILSRSPSPALRSASAATALQPSERRAAAANNLNTHRQRLAHLINKSETGRGLNDDEIIEVVALTELFNSTPPSRRQNNSERRQVSGRNDSLQKIIHEFETIRDRVLDKKIASKLTIDELLNFKQQIDILYNNEILWNLPKEYNDILDNINAIKYTITELIKKLQESTSRTPSERRPTATVAERPIHNNNAQLAEAIRQSLLSNPETNILRLLHATGLAEQQSGDLRTRIYANNDNILSFFYSIVIELTKSRAMPLPFDMFNCLGEFIKKQLAYIKSTNFTFTINRTIGKDGTYDSDIYKFFRFVEYDPKFCYEPQYMNQTCAVSAINNLLGLPLFTHDTRNTNMYIDLKINLPVLLPKLSTDFNSIYGYIDPNSATMKALEYLDKLIDLGILNKYTFDYIDTIIPLQEIFTQENFKILKKEFHDRRNFDYEHLKDISRARVTYKDFSFYRAKQASAQFGYIVPFDESGNYESSIVKLLLLPEFKFDVKVIIGEENMDYKAEIPQDTENLIGFFIRFGKHYMCIKRFGENSFLLLNSIMFEGKIPFICHGNYDNVISTISFVFEKNKRLITPEYKSLDAIKTRLNNQIESHPLSTEKNTISDLIEDLKLKIPQDTTQIAQLTARKEELAKAINETFKSTFFEIKQINIKQNQLFDRNTASSVYAVFFKDNGISHERGSSRA